MEERLNVSLFKAKARENAERLFILYCICDSWQREALESVPLNPSEVGARAGVREAAALEKLPEPERQAWEELWKGVAELIAKAIGDSSP